MAQLTFNARSVEPDAGMDPVPTGWYIAIMDQSEMKATADGQGERLAVRYQIIDGKYTNHKIFGGFNTRNSNPKTVDIAWRQLSAQCHAVGVLDLQDTNQLHNIPFKLKVVLQPAYQDKETGKTYEAKNEPRGWRHISEEVGDTSAAPAPTRSAPPMAAPPAAWSPAQPPQAQPWQQQAQAPAPQAAPSVGAPVAAPWGAQPQQPQQQAPAPAPWAPPAQPQQTGAQPPWAQQGPAQQPAAGGAPPWAQQQAPAPQQPPQQGPSQTQPQPWAGGPAPATPPWAQPR
jgi:hypothetical protein